jgi:hypothetical protein
MTKSNTDNLDIEIEVLKQQIELEVSNYKYAVELKKGYDILHFLREHIIKEKQQLYALINAALEIENKSY